MIPGTALSPKLFWARRQQIIDFQADVLVVIGDDRLHSQLEQFAKSQQQRQPVVIKLSKSGGVITRSVASRLVGQSSRVREYFYGTNNELCPSSNVLDLSAVQARLTTPMPPRLGQFVHALLVRYGACSTAPQGGRSHAHPALHVRPQVFNIGAAPQAPMSALPIGVRVQRDQMAATLLAATQYPSLVHSVLGVALTDSSKCDDLLQVTPCSHCLIDVPSRCSLRGGIQLSDSCCRSQANVAGFVFVTAVDMERKKITLLSPSPMSLPSTRFLSGAIKWLDG